MSTQLNRAPYMITSRDFPVETGKLKNVLSKAYFDTAQAVNERTIGIYDNFQLATGNKWLNTGDPTNRLQSFRKVFQLDGVVIGDNNLIPHGISTDSNTQFVAIYGTANLSTGNAFTQGMPVPYVDGTGGSDGIGIYLDDTDIHIVPQSSTWDSYVFTIVLEFILND